MRLALAVVAALWFIPAYAHADTYYMLVGSSEQSYDHPPVVQQNGRDYISLAVLAATGAPRGDVYTLGAHKLGVAAGQALMLDGKPLAARDELEAGRQRYVSRQVLESAGFRLAFDPLRNQRQLVGEIYRADYDSGKGELALECLTPIVVSGEQPKDDRGLVELTIEGGWVEHAPREMPADPLVTRVTFKGQPQLGRSIVFARQPERIGFSVVAPTPTSARVRFGNFTALSSYGQSASGELGMLVQLGAASDARAQMLDNPMRLVVDFPDTKVAAEQRSTSAVGHSTGLSLAQSSGGARLTVNLNSRVDFRLLPADGRCRWHIQLLPYAGASPAQKRSGRAIMIDSGHGGSDTGAIGVDGDIYEKDLNTQITALLAAELKRLGYTVLQTRPDDRFVSLGSRGDYSNLTLPYVFVSVHCNSFEPDHQGVIVFVHPAAGEASRKLAQDVDEAFVTATAAPNKGVRESDYFVLRETVVPSILVECGFMSNTEECGKLCDPAYQQQIASGIAAGIDRYVTGP